MRRYTVSWSPSARRKLAQMWLDNPLSRQQISEASDRIESALAKRPHAVGIAVSALSRLVALPPLAILFTVSEEDRHVRVIHVQFWEE